MHRIANRAGACACPVDMPGLERRAEKWEPVFRTSDAAMRIWSGLCVPANAPPAPAAPQKETLMADEQNILVLNLDSGGDVVIRLRPDLAPQHVARIRELAQEGFYDNVVFHRVIPGFMAQGGDPTGSGMGGSDKPNLPAEFSREPHGRGTASMARSQNPDSANSQFFICFEDCGFLDGQYTVWGEVIEGMEYVDALPKGEPPREPGKIVKASLRD
jgi:peptidylprolyl isomerase